MDKKTAPDSVPFSDTSSLDAVRQGQSRFGVRASRPCRNHAFREEDGLFLPAEKAYDGLLLYLHGGGYVSGSGAYADGAATILAAKLGIRVCRVDYGLAPEHPYPAALEDAAAAYCSLLSSGETAEKIVFFGDSSGGGLIYALAERLREEHLPQPAGLIAVSPWADLTLSDSADDAEDGMLTTGLLRGWAALYSGGADLRSPGLSPLFGDLRGLPPSLLFAGGDELLRTDAERLQKKLLKAGCRSTLFTAPGLWHTYLFSGVREAGRDFLRIRQFLSEILEGPESENPETGEPPLARPREGTIKAMKTKER